MGRSTVRRFRIMSVDGPNDRGGLLQFHDYIFEVELDPGDPYLTTRTKVRVTLFDTVFFAVASGDPHSSPYLEEAKALIARYVISALQNILSSSIPESPIELRLTEEDTKSLRSIDPARVDMREWQDVSTQASPDARRVFISSGQQSEEELKARSVTTIENLRRSITDQQREILSKIWGYYQGHREWIPTRLLHHDFGGKAMVRPALEQLGGSIVIEFEQTSTKYYQLTLLGVLLTDEGQCWQECLVGYLRYLSKVLAGDPLRTRVNSHEIADALNLNPDQCMVFRELIRFSSLLSRDGSLFSDHWEIEIPDSVEDLPGDLDQYISQVALKDYDLDTPLSAERKTTYQIAKIRQEDSPQLPQPTQEDLLPMVIVTGTRGYIENLAQQVNGCYRNGWYDACAVMARRLLEILIIDSFEARGKLSEIQRDKGEIVPLVQLIQRYLAAPQSCWHVERIARPAFGKIKAIGDIGAHGRYVRVTKQHLDKYQDALIAGIQQLVGTAYKTGEKDSQ